MDGFAHAPGALFAEDFDLPETATTGTVAAEPVYSASELVAAREAGWHDGHDAGLLEAATGDAAACAAAVRAIAEKFASESNLAGAQVEQSAEAIARLLLDSLAALFPTLCARYGEAEVRAIVRTVLPALTQEPAITIRANPVT